MNTLLRAQRLTKNMGMKPANVAIEQAKFTTSRQAIDFMKAKCTDFPDEAEVEMTINGEWMIFNSKPPSKENTVLYYIHGGAFVVGSPSMDRMVAYGIAKELNLPVFSITYRLAPQNRFPCAVIDTISGYQYLLKEGYKPSNIVIAGASAGGNLVVSLLMAIRDLSLPRPGGAITISPWVGDIFSNLKKVDLTASHPSFKENAATDFLPDIPLHVYNAYTTTEKINPFASPIYGGNFNYLPPILMQVGDKERLHDEGISLAYKIGKNNSIQLEIYEVLFISLFIKDQFHVFHILPILQSSKIANMRAADFIKKFVIMKEPFQSSQANISPNGFVSIKKNPFKNEKMS